MPVIVTAHLERRPVFKFFFNIVRLLWALSFAVFGFVLCMEIIARNTQQAPNTPNLLLLLTGLVFLALSLTWIKLMKKF